MHILNESLYYYVASYEKFVILSNRTHNNVIFKIHKIISVVLLFSISQTVKHFELKH